MIFLSLFLCTLNKSWWKIKQFYSLPDEADLVSETIIFDYTICENISQTFISQTFSDVMSDEEDIDVVKENLLCPVCDNYMCAPIRQCKTGHSICDQCFNKIKKCPKCRGPKSEARCYTLEAIAAKLKLSCR